MTFLSGSIEALQLNGSIFVVIGLFILYHLLMKIVFYRPLQRVLGEREALTEGKQAEAAQADAERQAMLERYEASIRAVRHETYSQLEATRKKAIADEAARLEAVMKEAADESDRQKQELARLSSELRASLESECTTFARMMAERILDREVRA